MDNLCFDCGMCCNGTLFDKVKVDDGDDLILPCVNLTNDNKCSIYENRPQRCRSYKCKMLMWYESNIITKKQALRLISDTKSGAFSKLDFFCGDNLERYTV